MAGSRPDFIDIRLVRALAHPLRVRMLQVLNERGASPAELGDLLDHPVGNVAYHARVLERCGCIELVATEPRRGAIEHYFRARPRSYIGHQDWRKVPRSVRSALTAQSVRAFLNQVIAALEAGTIDDREDTTLNWMSISLDEIGWAEATAALAQTLDRLETIHDQSAARVRVSGETPTSMVAGIAAFEAAGARGAPVKAEGEAESAEAAEVESPAVEDAEVTVAASADVVA